MTTIEQLGAKLEDLTSILHTVSDRMVGVERNIDSLDTGLKQTRDSVNKLYVTVNKLDDAVGQTEQQIQATKADVASLSHSAPPGPTSSLNNPGDKQCCNSTAAKPTAWQLLQDATQQDDTSAAETQRQFEQIKDSYCKVKLPSELKVYHAAAGIKSDCKPAYNLLKQSVSYHETTAKWLATQLGKFGAGAPAASFMRDDFHELFTILYAEAACYRSEYALQLVAGSTNPDTVQFYRLFERNPTVFSEGEIKHLSQAVELAGLKARNTPSAGGPRRQRGGGRGGRGGPPSQDGGFGRGYNFTYQNRNIPPKPRKPAGGQVSQSEDN